MGMELEKLLHDVSDAGGVFYLSRGEFSVRMKPGKMLPAALAGEVRECAPVIKEYLAAEFRAARCLFCEHEDTCDGECRFPPIWTAAGVPPGQVLSETLPPEDPKGRSGAENSGNVFEK